jgi:hypothetical protein
MAGVEPTSIGSKILGYLILTALVTAVLVVLLSSVAKIKSLILESFIPKTYSAERRAESRSRRLFSDYLRSEIIRLNRSENWRDDEFTELEAEIEGVTRRKTILSSLRGRSVFRAKSLTKALERSNERLILVEGDPGAGKSVSLRHVVHHLTSKAARSRRSDSVLPIYVNLKEIRRSLGVSIDRNLIKQTVVDSLSRINDRFVDEFLDKNFESGVRDGRWIFLFDSFDEIPEVLSSTDSDQVIKAYSEAIADFLGGLNKCRGIIASRAYRGPSAQDWTVFRVTTLSWRRQKDLIYKSLVNDIAAAREVEAGILNSTDDVRVMARNPMLLGLLCEHVRLNGEFPKTSYEVYSKYLDYRFHRDADRVSAKFGLQVEDLRRQAILAAFCMTADTGLGLTPVMTGVISSARSLGFRFDEKIYEKALRALAYMRLARVGDGDRIENTTFTFSHRRFQEYLATQIVLDDPDLVSLDQLLTDGRWRETAVVMIQTNAGQRERAIYDRALELLKSAIITMGNASRENVDGKISSFPWARKELHILGIIQAGRSTSILELPNELDELISSRLANLLDTKLALEVAGAANISTLTGLMKSALLTQSRWIGDIVYRQAARLAHPESAIYDAIRAYIVRLVFERRIQAEYHATKAFLGRLPESRSLVESLKLGRLIPVVDRWGFSLAMALSGFWGNAGVPFIIIAIILNIFAQLIQSDTHTSRIFTKNIRFLSVIFAVGSFIIPDKKIIFDVNMIRVFLVSLAIYLQLISASGASVIQRNPSARVYWIIILPFVAVYNLVDRLVRNPKQISRFLIAMSGIVLVPVMGYLALKLFPLFDVIFNAIAVFGAVAMATMIILAAFSGAREYRRYRTWARDTERFEPAVFETSFKSVRSALGHTLMLEHLRRAEIRKPWDGWNDLTVRLINNYAIRHRNVDDLNSGKYMLPDGTKRDSPIISQKVRAPWIERITKELYLISFVLFDRDYVDRRRDLLFINLERFANHHQAA